MKSRPGLLAAVVLLAIADSGSLASARTIETYDAGAPVAPRAPDGPPLSVETTPQSSMASSAAGEDASAAAPVSGGDPLVRNGLASPLCRGAATVLSAPAKRNCQSSEFEASAAPTANYALDVHIDGGLLGVNTATLMQDYLIAPLWMGLVWVIHVLLVAFEWCFTIDPANDAVLAELAKGLRETEASFTQPLLGVALALASVFTLYHGLIRRRVADTIAQAAVTLVMIAVGMWVILDPAGTVGVLGRWSNQLNLGTLGAVVDGTPAHAPRTLADSMGMVFVGAVSEPWCFLEFGNVGWCADPARLDARLHAAGLRLAREGQGDQLLREARTNGALFLALPANQTARNSINSPGSLLRTLCASSDATACRGSTAEMAEFRTASGTYPRLEGLILIAIGALGLIGLLGSLAMHLLGSAVVGLLYLLVAPAAVLAPAFGDHGRAIFRTWAIRLLSAFTSKLLYSFLLGVVLSVTRLLMSLHTPGFWTRWILLSVLWWSGFRHRHQALGLWREHQLPRSHGRGVIRRALIGALPTPRQLVGVASRTIDPADGRSAAPERQHRAPAQPRQASTPGDLDEQVMRTIVQEQRSAKALLDEHPGTEVRIAAQRERLARIRTQQNRASVAGNTRRATSLDFRAKRLQADVRMGEQALERASKLVSEGAPGRGAGGRDRLMRRGRFLDAQAILPAAGMPAAASHGGERRAYAALAGLAGYGAQQYERLEPAHQRRVRAQIDSQLAARRGARGLAAEAELAAHRVPRRAAGSDERRGGPGAAAESPVMQDIFEFIEGRKSTLGWGASGPPALK